MANLLGFVHHNAAAQQRRSSVKGLTIPINNSRYNLSGIEDVVRGSLVQDYALYAADQSEHQNDVIGRWRTARSLPLRGSLLFLMNQQTSLLKQFYRGAD